MTTQWVMTAGYPGGEFAGTANAMREFVLAQDGKWPVVKSIDFAYHIAGDCHIRPCPPDLVEWIEAISNWDDAPGFTSNQIRLKVAGGWLYAVKEFDTDNLLKPRRQPAYVPVAGAAGLTVLEVQE